MKILSLTLNNINIDFLEGELWWRTYIIQKTILTIKYVKLRRKKKFIPITLDSRHKTFEIHITLLTNSISLTNSNIHLFYRTQIASFIAKKDLIKVFIKYTNFTDMFSPNLASNLSKFIRINNHTIKPENSQQLPYGPIYSLGPIILEILKAYIKTNLANSFIKQFKLFASILIYFN